MKEKNIKALVFGDIQKAISNVKDGGKYKGFHSVYSGFWNYEKAKHGITSEALSEVLKALCKEGLIAQRGVAGGYLIFLAGDVKADSGKRFEDLLK